MWSVSLFSQPNNLFCVDIVGKGYNLINWVGVGLAFISSFLFFSVSHIWHPWPQAPSPLPVPLPRYSNPLTKKTNNLKRVTFINNSTLVSLLDVVTCSKMDENRCSREQQTLTSSTDYHKFLTIHKLRYSTSESVESARLRFSADQIDALERVFVVNPYPQRDVKNKLCRSLNLTRHQVTVNLYF